jgi:hypothetical protein
MRLGNMNCLFYELCMNSQSSFILKLLIKDEKFILLALKQTNILKL